MLGGTSNYSEYAKADHTNVNSRRSYMKNKELERQNKETDLDYFGFRYVQGKTESGDPDEDGNICLIENAKAIFREIEKERSKRQENEDLFFFDYNSISVANSSSKMTILDFE